MKAAALFLAWVLADPPAGDARRLPALAELQAAVRFNRAYQDRLADRLKWQGHHLGELRAALDEAEWIRFHVYDAAWGAHPDYDCSDECRRVYLRRLRLALGRDRYRDMDLGPVVPVWRFGEMRR